MACIVPHLDYLVAIAYAVVGGALGAGGMWAALRWRVTWSIERRGQ